MTNVQDLQSVMDGNGTVVDSNGDKIGKVSQVFLDDDTSEPEWVTAKTGLFGGAETFIPLKDAKVSGSEVRVPFDKDTVKGAPRIDDADGHLSPEEENELYRYYSMEHSSSSQQTSQRSDTQPNLSHQDTVVGAGAGGDGLSRTDTDADSADVSGTTSSTGTGTGTGTDGRDTSGPTTDDAMTRSEEQLNVGTEKVSAGKARLRKYVVTENVATTVPVSHEEVRIEREPITDENRGQATSGGDITSDEHEMDLTEERVVVTKETVPVERVTMSKDTVTDEQTVNDEVRKEQIDTDAATR